MISRIHLYSHEKRDFVTELKIYEWKSAQLQNLERRCLNNANETKFSSDATVFRGVICKML